MILKNTKKSNNCIIFVITVVVLLFLSSLFLHFNSINNSTSIENNKQNASLAQSIFQTKWIVETHEKQWIKNSEFDTVEDWSSFEQGDASDVDAYVSSGQANFEVLGESGIFNIHLIHLYQIAMRLIQRVVLHLIIGVKMKIKPLWFNGQEI